jgi:hypothetical protein
MRCAGFLQSNKHRWPALLLLGATGLLLSPKRLDFTHKRTNHELRRPLLLAAMPKAAEPWSLTSCENLEACTRGKPYFFRNLLLWGTPAFPRLLRCGIADSFAGRVASRPLPESPR